MVKCPQQPSGFTPKTYGDPRSNGRQLKSNARWKLLSMKETGIEHTIVPAMMVFLSNAAVALVTN